MIFGIIIFLILVVCALLSLVILVQNPKGGGLSGTFGGVSNQILGAGKSSDVIVKATWGFAIGLLVLSLGSTAFMTTEALPDDVENVATETEVEKQAQEFEFDVPESDLNLDELQLEDENAEE